MQNINRHLFVFQLLFQINYHEEEEEEGKPKMLHISIITICVLFVKQKSSF